MPGGRREEGRCTQGGGKRAGLRAGGVPVCALSWTQSMGESLGELIKDLVSARPSGQASLLVSECALCPGCRYPLVPGRGRTSEDLIQSWVRHPSVSTLHAPCAPPHTCMKEKLRERPPDNRTGCPGPKSRRLWHRRHLPKETRHEAVQNLLGLSEVQQTKWSTFSK